uniref:Uncharacterized protein n=1 Tax=Sphaeramia orbicularis TaxID=375764 RepID=A0A673C7U2_9TELE
SAISSGSLEHSSRPGIRTCQWCCGLLFQGSENSLLQFLTLRSIFAKPKALDARSLASWNSSLSDRLKSNDCVLHYLISSEAVLSSALSQNLLLLFCRPASRNSPVDFSSIPAMSTNQKSFPDWASPPRM